MNEQRMLGKPKTISKRSLTHFPNTSYRTFNTTVGDMEIAKFTDSIKINRPGYNISTGRIFDSRPLIYNKKFLKKHFLKFVVHIFTLLLAPFASKWVNYSGQNENLNMQKNSEIDDIFLWWRLFVDFQTYFKGSVHSASKKWPIWTEMVLKEA